MTHGWKKIFFLFTLGLLGSSLGLNAAENITLDLRSVDVRDAMRLIAKQSNSNIITEKSVRGNVSIALDNVYFEEAMNLIAKTNGFAIRKIGNTYVVANEKVLEQGFDKGRTMTKRLQFANAEDIRKIISTTIKKDVQVATDARTNSVVVSGTQEVLKQVKKLIEAMDTPVHQVLIEAKIVEVNTTANKTIGFKWAWGEMVNGADPGVVPPGGSDAGAVGGSGGIYSLAESSVRHGKESSYAKGFNQAGGTDSAVPPFSFGDFYRGQLIFRATLDALIRNSEAKTLSNPKIVTLNGEKAVINVGRKIIYPGGADQPPKEKDVGVNLEITPTINDDGYITADIVPEVSNVIEFQGQFPIIGQKKAQTRVRVRDGEEILIGGLISESTNNSQSKIPVLGDIPIVKNFFTSKNRQSDATELIILITPHVISQALGSGGPAGDGTFDSGDDSGGMGISSQSSGFSGGSPIGTGGTTNTGGGFDPGGFDSGGGSNGNSGGGATTGQSSTTKTGDDDFGTDFDAF